MNLNNKLDNLPLHFIVGAGRSGTTLLRAMLNAHPRISCTPEVKPIMTFYHYANYSPLPKQLITDFVKFNKLRYGSKALKKKFDSTQHGGISFEDFVAVLQNQLPTLNYGNFCKLALLYLNRADKTIDNTDLLVDKNPGYTFNVEALLQLYPQAKVAVAIRDYRSYALSQKQSQANNLFSRFLGRRATTSAYFWQLHYTEVIRLQQKYPGQISMIAYEDLITNKKDTLQSLCNFWQISLHDNMLHHEQHLTTADEPDDDTLSERQQKTKGDVSKTTFTNRLEAWKNELSPAEIQTCEAICGETGTQFGYLPTQNISNTQRFWVYLSGALPIAITYISTQLFMKHYYSLPLVVRNFLIKYLKFRH
jgi:hypothetical protein